MSVRQRGSSIRKVILRNGEVRWRFRLDLEPGADGKRRQQTVTCRTEAEAIDRQAKARAQIATGGYVEPDKRTVADVIDSFLLARAQRWKPSTAYQNETSLRIMRELLGTRRVQRLRREDVDRAVVALRSSGGRSGSGRSARTVQVAVQLLSAALDLAVRDELVHRNVARDVQLPSVHPEEASTWSAPELARFLKAAEDDPLVFAYHLLALGLRRGEVLGLTWADVDELAGVVHVRQTRVVAGGKVVTVPPKSLRSRRTVPLTPGAKRALRMTRERTLGAGTIVPLRQRGGSAGARFVVVDEAGEPLAPWELSRRSLALAKATGLPHIRVHDIRHSVATIMLEAGQPPHVVARILGHDPAVLMKVYAHVTERSAAAAITALGDALGTG